MKWSIRLTSLFSFLLGIVLLVCSQTQNLKIVRAADGIGPQSRINQTGLGADAWKKSGRARAGIQELYVDLIRRGL